MPTGIATDRQLYHFYSAGVDALLFNWIGDEGKSRSEIKERLDAVSDVLLR